MSRIQKKNRHSQLFPRIYAGIFVCMIILLIYLGINQRSAVAQKNPSIESRRVQNVTCTEILDDSAPAGLRREYILEDIQKEQSNDCLAFYLVHQYAQVYIEDELVYSLTPENAAFVNQDVGCNWVMLPLSQDMVGKQMQIVVTPIYQEVKNRTTEFLIGSRYRISLETVRSDLADILLSIVALGVGIGFMVISPMSLLQRKGKNTLLYLGLFSACIGTWKILDIQSAPLIFYRHPMLLSQISLAALSLAVVPFILYIQLQFKESRHRVLDVAGGISLLNTFLQILLQLTGLMDMRESLQFTHISMGVTVIAVIHVVIAEWHKKRRDRKLWLTMGFFLLCVVGVVLDVGLFYIKGNSFRLLNTLVLFVVYIIAMGSMTLVEMNQRAMIDYSTGLYNRSRCSELLRSEDILENQVCLIMFDLNQLKMVNDTWGHEAGDEMISRFANALQQTIPASAFLGRYGGDEFIAVIRECTPENVEDILSNLEKTISVDNARQELKVHYAVGYAMSDDCPESTLRILLKKADQAMYEHKRKFYEHMGKNGRKFMEKEEQ